MNYHIQQLQMNRFGMISSFECNHFSNINLIIGENGTGKTFFLKALYAAVRSMEECGRGDDIRTINEILSEKLRWTFEVNKLGEMVTRAASENLTFDCLVGNDRLAYQFSPSAAKKVNILSAPQNRREANSIFIPAKEVLSLYSVIFKSREEYGSFGFDDTYYDLVKALRISPKRGKNYSAFSDSRKTLSGVIDGKVEFDEKDEKWFYRDSHKQKFSIGATSEGIKKISILDRLLSNGYLDNHSVIFIDEAEAALHPTAICSFLEMIADISEKLDIQFFLSTHSYFVIKKLALLAMKKPDFVTCISLNKDSAPEIHDLQEGIPHNSIIQTSIDLYRQEIEEGL